ncbi:MAG TPA: beta-N-acetylhexosaminidase [Chloroflexota bacterium]|nr:beta-N-acetylhexosaminidase [Chloroflexota bacterium]
MTVNRRRFLLTGTALAASAVVRNPFRALASPRAPQTLEEKVGQLFVVSLQGTTPHSAFLSSLQRHRFGGVILYANNYASPAQLRTLLGTVQRASPFPLLICTDQEGGAVIRFRNGVHTFPSEADYGRIGSTARVYADAATTAHDLRALGLTLNLAPVVDVLSNAKSPIGTRSYGPNPQLDAALSVAAIQGYQQHRLAATAKHFIGLGHTSIDSHQTLPTVKRSLAQLAAVDLVPFRAAIAAGVSTILVAHVALPAIDPIYRPASLSPVIIKHIIRNYLGFRGVVMTDSLAMGAINGIGTPEAAVQALAAGADILLIASNQDIPGGVIDDAVNQVVAAVRAGRISESRVDRSVARILALKRAYPPAVLG